MTSDADSVDTGPYHHFVTLDVPLGERRHREVEIDGGRFPRSDVDTTEANEPFWPIGTEALGIDLNGAA